jgi:hypothetical protein
MSATEQMSTTELSDINDRVLSAGAAPARWNSNDTYYKHVLRRLQDLPMGHPDKYKFTLEQARLRCGDKSIYLRDFAEPFELP